MRLSLSCKTPPLQRRTGIRNTIIKVHTTKSASFLRGRACPPWWDDLRSLIALFRLMYVTPIYLIRIKAWIILSPLPCNPALLPHSESQSKFLTRKFFTRLSDKKTHKTYNYRKGYALCNFSFNFSCVFWSQQLFLCMV
jgi:hypothetical protein